jgi:hypothetical protein
MVALLNDKLPFNVCSAKYSISGSMVSGSTRRTKYRRFSCLKNPDPLAVLSNHPSFFTVHPDVSARTNWLLRSVGGMLALVPVPVLVLVLVLVLVPVPVLVLVLVLVLIVLVATVVVG